MWWTRLNSEMSKKKENSDSISADGNVTEKAKIEPAITK